MAGHANFDVVNPIVRRWQTPASPPVGPWHEGEDG